MLPILVGSLVAALAVNTVLAVVHRGRLLARLSGDAAERVRFFRNAIAGAWALAGVAALIVVAPGDELGPGDVGWAWSAGGLAGLTPAAGAVLTGLLTVVTVGLTISSAPQTRARIRAGHPVDFPRELAVLLPRTPQERRLVAGAAVTAGVTEEIVYRGFLIGAVVTVFDAPVLPVAALSLVLFVAAHAYQGRRGLAGVSAAGLLLTLLYVLSGSILPGIVVHVVQDLAGLLTVPPTAEPIGRPAGAGPVTAHREELLDDR